MKQIVLIRIILKDRKDSWNWSFFQSNLNTTTKKICWVSWPIAVPIRLAFLYTSRLNIRVKCPQRNDLLRWTDIICQTFEKKLTKTLYFCQNSNFSTKFGNTVPNLPWSLASVWIVKWILDFANMDSWFCKDPTNIEWFIEMSWHHLSQLGQNKI